MDKKKDHYSVIIIGGGIVGIGIFRDLALHGIDTLIVDRGTFSSQTSSRSSKMLHGGIRYLEMGDFFLVKQALDEKNLWLSLCPDLCKEKAFHLLNYTWSKYSPLETKLGLYLYDFLSDFKNSPSKQLNKNQTIEKFPNINSKDLLGCSIYYDAVMDDKKLAQVCLKDGLMSDSSSFSREFFSIKNIKKYSSNNNIWNITGHDILQNTNDEYTADHIIVCAGPFTDKIVQDWNAFPWNNTLRPTRGAHIVIQNPHFFLTSPIVINSKDGRVIFVIPQEKDDNSILVGTTEMPYCAQELDYFNPCINDRERNYLLEELNIFFPNNNIDKSWIKEEFVGYRPLVCQDNQSRSAQISREHQIFQPYSNLDIIVGGKYTTFRVMGQEISRRIVEKIGKIYNPNATKKSLKIF